MTRLRKSYESQRSLLNALINKTIYDLLIEQESILASIHFPRFSFMTLQQIEQAVMKKTQTLQSQSQQTTGTYRGMLGGGHYNTSTIDNPIISSEIVRQQKLVCGFLSIRLMYQSPQLFVKIVFPPTNLAIIIAIAIAIVIAIIVSTITIFGNRRIPSSLLRLKSFLITIRR